MYVWRLICRSVLIDCFILEGISSQGKRDVIEVVDLMRFWVPFSLSWLDIPALAFWMGKMVFARVLRLVGLGIMDLGVSSR